MDPDPQKDFTYHHGLKMSAAQNQLAEENDSKF